MTPLEYREHVQKFLPSVGLKAEIYTSIETEQYREKLYSAALYPQGIASRNDEGYLRVHADIIDELWDEIQTKWSAHRERHRQHVTRKMALAIIRLTSELGECTDAALRAEFDPAEINSYGEDACVDANEMAGRGPFSIKAMGGANTEAA
jgi:hypothetical protein